MDKGNLKIPRPVANVSNRNVGSYGNNNTRNYNTGNNNRVNYNTETTVDEDPYRRGIPRLVRTYATDGRGGRHQRKSRKRRSRKSRRRSRRHRH
jgi:hypothetical protein